MSLETHPNPAIQARSTRHSRAARSQRIGNNGFEVAAAYFNATGRRDLLDRAINNAAALYDDFARNNPPFSGGERDAINCVQLYRVTHDKKHLDLAKHYLDIRGLENSVDRSRHNQSYKPVLEQSEAVGHAVNCVSLMVSLADVGVLTGLKGYLAGGAADVDRRRVAQDVHHRRRRLDRQRGLRRAVLAAQHQRVRGNLRRADVHDAEPAAVHGDRRQQVHRRDGARHVQQRARRRVRAGDRFFYVNRLASAGDGRDLRWDRASLECCPPNLVRFLASMPWFVYAQDQAGAVFVNLYVSSDASFKVGGKR